MCVHGDINKRDGLKFDFNVYDTVILGNGARGIITNYGIYDNQYWCEIPETRKCGLSDWHWYNNNNVTSNIIVGKIEDIETINSIRRKYLEKLLEKKEDFNINNKEFDAEINRARELLMCVK